MLLFACVAGVAFASQDIPPPNLPKPLNAYPDEKSLGDVAHWQLKGEGVMGAPKVKPLVIVSYSGLGDTASWYGIVVDEFGNATSFRNIWNWAVQGGSITAVGKPVDPQVVSGHLDKLGPSLAPPSLEKVLIVSFRKGRKWNIRLYSRQDAPEALREMWRYLARRGLAGDPPPPWEKKGWRGRRAIRRVGATVVTMLLSGQPVQEFTERQELGTVEASELQ